MAFHTNNAGFINEERAQEPKKKQTNFQIQITCYQFKFVQYLISVKQTNCVVRLSRRKKVKIFFSFNEHKINAGFFV